MTTATTKGRKGRPLYTPGDFAQYLGVTTQSVYQWMRRGQIVPSFTTVKGISLFAEDEAERWKRERDAK